MQPRDEYRRLMKEATTHKKTNLYRSIELIREAISSCPSCARWEGHNRLAKFLTLASRHDEALDVYRSRLQQEASRPDRYHGLRADVYREVEDHFRKRGRHAESSQYRMLRVWHQIVATALTGQRDHLNHLLADNQLLSLAGEMLERGDGVNATRIMERFRAILEEQRQLLSGLAKIYVSFQSSDQFWDAPISPRDGLEDRTFRLLLEKPKYRRAVAQLRSAGVYDLLQSHGLPALDPTLIDPEQK